MNIVALGLKKFSTNDKVINAIYQQVKNGLNISMDHEGNLWAKRVCQCPVFARSFSGSDQEVIRIEKRPTKIFDIQSLKTNLICSLRKMPPTVVTTDRELEKMCFVCLQIGCREKALLQAPSWLIIVHLVALEFLNVFAEKEKSRISSRKSQQGSSYQCPVEASREGPYGKMYSKHITSVSHLAGT
uniref:MH2 domain-containing protein n=1 Tax=Romanomermis culicivorax TaxID=13658 RepID=A0A915KJ22_ROMCU